jgi:hypothetical protein
VKRLTYVEADLEVCSLTYGVLPCRASLGSGFPAGGVPAVTFDGTATYLTRGAGLTGSADGKQFTIAGAFRRNAGDGVAATLFTGSDGVGGANQRGVTVEVDSNNALVISARDTSGTLNLVIRSANGAAQVADAWVPFAASVDLTDTNKRHLYIGGLAALSAVPTYTDSAIDLTQADWAVGADANGTDKLNGAVAFLWFDDAYLNLADPDVLALFFETNGVQKYLGAAGAGPTGSAPLVYLVGLETDATDWHTNKGTGGGFTITGGSPLTSARLYGTGERKCFNTLKTCQDPISYDPETVTFRWGRKGVDYAPMTIDAIPSVTSVDFSPGQISLGDGLGQRASVSVTFADHPWGDTGPGYDPYVTERPYDPFAQGSYWGKFRARQPYLTGRPFRVYRGLEGQTLEQMEIRHFFLEEYNGPTAAGQFTMVAKDVLKLADNDRAQCPVTNTGFLSASIDADDITILIAPAGTLLAEGYDQAEYINIGNKEIAAVAYVGGNDDDTKLMVHADGVDGTTSFSDASGSGHTLTAVGQAQIGTSQFKFGGSAAQFDGSGDYITAPDHADWTLPGDFAIDAWVRPTSLATATRGIISHRTDNNDYWAFGVSTTGVLFFEVMVGGVVTIQATSAAAAVVINVWTHVAVTRSGTTYRLFVNGALVATVVDADAIANHTGELRIGTTAASTTTTWAGHIDELRLSHVARWTAAFTVPAYAYTTADELVLTARGALGTTAEAHEDQELAQIVKTWSGEDAADILYDLLVNYAAVPSDLVPLASWLVETGAYLGRLYTAVIATPTGVNTLITDLLLEAGLAMWWSDIEQEIRLRVLRAIDTDAATFDASNIVGKTFDGREQPDKRLSQVWTFFGMRNPLRPREDADNYRSCAVYQDVDAEAAYGSAVIRKIFSRYIPAFGRTTADRTNEILISARLNPPRRFDFEVSPDEDGRAPAILGNGYRLGFRTLQDDTGAAVLVPIIVTAINHEEAGANVSAEEANLVTVNPGDLTDRQIIIEADELDFNALLAHNSVYPALTDADVLAGVNLTVTINENVIVGSTSTATPAFLVPTGWPVGLPILVVNLGRIQGTGGQGGAAGDEHDGYPGQPGGLALKVEVAIDLDNSDGEVFGGGGGGGGRNNASGDQAGSGGGGAGFLPGAPGPGAPIGEGDVAASPGTTEEGGDSGHKEGVDPGADGRGGDPGEAGADGADAGEYDGGAGGAAGGAIEGVGLITFIGGTGTILGTQT